MLINKIVFLNNNLCDFISKLSQFSQPPCISECCAVCLEFKIVRLRQRGQGCRLMTRHRRVPRSRFLYTGSERLDTCCRLWHGHMLVCRPSRLSPSSPNTDVQTACTQHICTSWNKREKVQSWVILLSRHKSHLHHQYKKPIVLNNLKFTGQAIPLPFYTILM